MRHGEVHLLLPSFVSNDEGMDFLERKRAWVHRILEKHRLRAREIVPKRYVDGEMFDFLGQRCRLQICRGKKNHVERVGETLLVGLAGEDRHPETVRKAVWQWYRSQAKRILTEKTDYYVGRLGGTYAGVRLRLTKTKWGHCTAEGIIQYNWQIMAAPEPVVDYLVAHEVSHLVHLNHSPAFWELVGRLHPGYEKQLNWLRRKGHTITF